MHAMSLKGGSRTSKNCVRVSWQLGTNWISARYWYGSHAGSGARVFMRVLKRKADTLNTNWASSLEWCCSLWQHSLPDISAKFYQFLSICSKAIYIYTIKTKGVRLLCLALYSHESSAYNKNNLFYTRVFPQEFHCVTYSYHMYISMQTICSSVPTKFIARVIASTGQNLRQYLPLIYREKSHNGQTYYISARITDLM